MELINTPINDLKPFDSNPREISDKKLDELKKSIQTFGLFKPILVWKDHDENLVVIGGNQRLRAITEMVSSNEIEMDTIPTIRWDGDKASAHTIALRDNNSDGDWAWDSLGNYIAELESMSQESGLDLSLTGFEPTLIQDLKDLSTSVDSNLDRFTSKIEDDDDDEELDLSEESLDDEDDDIESPLSTDVESDSKTGRQVARFTVGSIRGQIGVEQYRRFLHVWQVYSDSTGSTDIKTILDSLLTDLEASEKNEIRASALESIEEAIKTHLTNLAVTDADHAALGAVGDVFKGLRSEWIK